MLFVGIDPGKTGAVAWMDSARVEIAVQSCPLLPGKQYDRPGMLALLRRISSGNVCMVTVEDVNGYRGQSAARSFSFGVGVGLWQMALAALELEVRYVLPRVWKAAMLHGVANDPKMEAQILEQRLSHHHICRSWTGKFGGIDDGKVDAVWLAEYGRVTWTQSHAHRRRE